MLHKNYFSEQILDRPKVHHKVFLTLDCNLQCISLQILFFHQNIHQLRNPSQQMHLLLQKAKTEQITCKLSLLSYKTRRSQSDATSPYNCLTDTGKLETIHATEMYTEKKRASAFTKANWKAKCHKYFFNYPNALMRRKSIMQLF